MNAARLLLVAACALPLPAPVVHGRPPTLCPEAQGEIVIPFLPATPPGYPPCVSIPTHTSVRFLNADTTPHDPGSDPPGCFRASEDAGHAIVPTESLPLEFFWDGVSAGVLGPNGLRACDSQIGVDPSTGAAIFSYHCYVHEDFQGVIEVRPVPFTAPGPLP